MVTAPGVPEGLGWDGAITCTSVLLGVVPAATAATSPSSRTSCTLLPPPSRPVPVMLTSVPAKPLLGVTAAMLPPASCVQLLLACSTAPLWLSSSTASATPPALALPPAAVTTTTLALLRTTCATRPPSRTCATASLSPPPSRPVPEMVTVVPLWPVAGCTLPMLPGASKSQLPPSTTAPVSTRMRTSPPVLAALRYGARTCTRLSLPSPSSVASSPPSVTRTTRCPPASRSVPVMLTSVPSRPLPGVTAAITPAATYVQPPASSTRAPDTAVSTTASAGGPTTPPAPASTTTRSLFCVTMLAATPPSVTLLRLAAWPSRLVPLMATTVPACPAAGLTVSIAPAARYCQAPPSTKAPLTASMRTRPAVAAAAAAAAAVDNVGMATEIRNGGGRGG
eukprot:m.242494 g.242494  ORF g.242494 m.242494 type:complete len:395 (+) comp22541_c6_seq3:4223-5407(+)